MNPGYIVQNEQGEWNETVANLQAWNNKIIDEQLTEHNLCGFTYMGHIFQSDPTSIQNISGSVTFAMILLQQGQDMPAGFTWRSKDNENIAMTAVQLIGLGQTLFSFISANYFVSFAHKGKIMALADIQQLLDYDSTTSWLGTLNTPSGSDAGNT
jgi:hypothetical protein